MMTETVLVLIFFTNNLQVFCVCGCDCAHSHTYTFTPFDFEPAPTCTEPLDYPCNTAIEQFARSSFSFSLHTLLSRCSRDLFNGELFSGEVLEQDPRMCRGRGAGEGVGEKGTPNCTTPDSDSDTIVTLTLNSDIIFSMMKEVTRQKKKKMPDYLV